MPEEHKFETPQPVTPGPATHPGPWIRSVLLKPLGLSEIAAAEALRYHRGNLNKTLNGKKALTNDLAYRLEALTGFDAKLLIAMQAGYDWDRDAGIREALKAQIQRLTPPAEAAEPAAKKKAG